MFTYLKIMLYYYDIWCHNATYCVTVHCVSCVGGGLLMMAVSSRNM